MHFMKLLRVKANNFKNCEPNFTIDMVAKSKKTSEDKEYELLEVAKDLYVYNTIAFVGKNASGKTSAIELLECCYSILGDFRLENKHYEYEGVELEIIFYHDDYIYCYTTKLNADTSLGNKAVFSEQHLYKKKYYKSNLKTLYDLQTFDEIQEVGVLPEDTAIVFFALGKRDTRALYFDSFGEGADSYQLIFRAMKNYQISDELFLNVIQIFDENIKNLVRIDEHNYKLTYQDDEKIMSDRELIFFLSSGTTKGILLYVLMIASLQKGFDLLIDEIENHFHKTLVENMICLYKDKNVNRHNASLIFTTHYCEILDLFNRRDNIWIARSQNKISLSNMYENFNVRTELLKSKQFYNNTFQTAVNYEELMNMKRKLME